MDKFYALEPNRGMIRLAERRRHETKINIEFLDLPGERIPLKDDTIDTVVSAFTLCMIAGTVDAIRRLARVLKPDGAFIFFELGLSPEVGVHRWQRQLERLHRWLLQGLHLTGTIPALTATGGFQIEQ